MHGGGPGDDTQKGKFNMQRFKLGFRNKSAVDQLTLCERTLTRLAAPNQPQSNPTQLTDAQTTVAALRTCHDRVESLRRELKGQLSHRKELLRSARDQVTRACLGAADAVDFDPAKLLAAGLQLEASKTVPVGVPAAPHHLRAAPTLNEGEVRLDWRRTVRRCWFEIECRPDPEPEGWNLIASASRQSHLATGLLPGVKYWFRVRAGNSHGLSPWSNLVLVRAK